jgi:hypothetical protein
VSAADLAIAEAVIGAAKALCEERFSTYADQRRLPTPPLVNLLRDVGREGERAHVRDRALLEVLGFPRAAAAGPEGPTAKDVWQHLIEATLGDAAEHISRARA